MTGREKFKILGELDFLWYDQNNHSLGFVDVVDIYFYDEYGRPFKNYNGWRTLCRYFITCQAKDYQGDGDLYFWKRVSYTKIVMASPDEIFEAMPEKTKRKMLFYLDIFRGGSATAF